MACKMVCTGRVIPVVRSSQIHIFSFQEDYKLLNSLLGPHFEHAVTLKFSLCRTESVSLSTIFVNTKSPKYTGNCYKLENLYNFLFLIINEDVHRTKFCMFCQKITCFENRSFKHNSLLMTNCIHVHV